jgi:hypothetical protein
VCNPVRREEWVTSVRSATFGLTARKIFWMNASRDVKIQRIVLALQVVNVGLAFALVALVVSLMSNAVSLNKLQIKMFDDEWNLLREVGR